MSEPALPPSASTMLVILLGASAWPNSPGFQASKAFMHAAHGFRDYLLDPGGFRLPAANLLDLFDAPSGASDQLEQLESFLQQRSQALIATNQEARDVLVYFVGHGGFVGSSHDFYLMPRRANASRSSLRASGLSIDALADVLREQAHQARRYLLLDCCFAAAAFRSFLGGPDQTAIEKTLDAFAVQTRSSGFPGRGTVLLCSSDQKSPSLLLPDESCTMFSRALLDVLRDGDLHRTHPMSFRDIKELTEDRLMALPEKNAPRPGLYSPDQSEGDVANVPLFPNSRAEEERRRQTEEAKRRQEKAEQARLAKEERARVAEEEQVRKAEEDRRRQAEAERTRLAEEEKERAHLAEVEQLKKAEEEQERLRRAEEEKRRQAEQERVHKAWEEEQVRPTKETEQQWEKEEEQEGKAAEAPVRGDEDQQLVPPLSVEKRKTSTLNISNRPTDIIESEIPEQNTPIPEYSSIDRHPEDIANGPIFPNPHVDEEKEPIHEVAETKVEPDPLIEEEPVRKLAEEERTSDSSSRLLETVITNKGNEPDAVALVRQQFTESDVVFVFVLGSPAGDTSTAGTGTENIVHLLQFTINHRFRRKQIMIPVFTQVNIMQEALQRNPAWQSLQLQSFAFSGKALLENLDQDVTIVIDPWSPLEFRLPVAQKRMRKAEKEHRREVASTRHRQFIFAELGITPFVVWCQAFALLTGLGSMVDLLVHPTQSLHWVVGIVALATPLAYILAIGTVALAAPLTYLLGYRKAMNLYRMTIIALLSAAAVFGLTLYFSKLDFDHSRTSQLWFNLTRMLWLGRQANFGLIIGSSIGAIGGGVLIGVAGDALYPPGGVTLVVFMVVGYIVILISWFVFAILPSIFQWGFGFGYGWDTSLIAAGIGFVATMGLILSLFVWTKALKRTIVK